MRKILVTKLLLKLVICIFCKFIVFLLIEVWRLFVCICFSRFYKIWLPKTECWSWQTAHYYRIPFSFSVAKVLLSSLGIKCTFALGCVALCSWPWTFCIGIWFLFTSLFLRRNLNYWMITFFNFCCWTVYYYWKKSFRYYNKCRNSRFFKCSLLLNGQTMWNLTREKIKVILTCIN